MQHRRIPSVSTCMLILFSLCLFPFQTTQAQDIPPHANVYGVYGHAQNYNLSCESRSASDWAAYFGVFASEYDILAALPRTDNPETGFVGSPSGDWGLIPPRSYGVHPPPVAAVLQSYGLNAQARSGMSWDDLRSEIAAERPVIVWIVGSMWAGTPITYTASDGETTTVAQHEHTMILTGYSESQVYVVDAYTGLDQIYDLNSFLISWAVLGNRGILLEGPPPEPIEKPQAGDQRYVVRPGETLSGIAAQFNVAWQDLAQLNDIVYPYLVYVDQELLLPVDAQPAEPQPPEEPPQPTPTPYPTPVAEFGIYTVRVGDTLVGLADQFGVSWQVLVAANGMKRPYFIYPGQSLNLPKGSGG